MLPFAMVNWLFYFSWLIYGVIQHPGEVLRDLLSFWGQIVFDVHFSFG
jgi:hypothetical protein